MQFSQKQLEREALPVLRRLAAPGAYLQKNSDARSACGLMVKRNDFARPVANVDAELARCLEVRGWVSRIPLDRLELAAAGASWLEANGVRLSTAARRMFALTSAIAGEQQDKPKPAANERENPLTWMAGRKGPDGRKLLTPEMLEAGERLRRDFETGHMGQRVTAAWDAYLVSGARGRSGVPDAGMPVTERALAARQRVWKALEAVGPGLSSVLLEVCCLASGLEAAERRLKWPKRSAKLVLVIALDRLTAHYGYGGQAAAETQSGAASSWGLADYKPALLGHLEPLSS